MSSRRGWRPRGVEVNRDTGHAMGAQPCHNPFSGEPLTLRGDWQSCRPLGKQDGKTVRCDLIEPRSVVVVCFSEWTPAVLQFHGQQMVRNLIWQASRKADLAAWQGLIGRPSHGRSPCHSDVPGHACHNGDIQVGRDIEEPALAPRGASASIADESENARLIKTFHADLTCGLTSMPPPRNSVSLDPFEQSAIDRVRRVRPAAQRPRRSSQPSWGMRPKPGRRGGE